VVTTFLASLAFERFSLAQVSMGQTSLDLQKPSELKRTVRLIVGLTLVLEAVGFVALFAIWKEGTLEERAFHSLFHAVSAFCNAGISSLPNGLIFEGWPLVKIAIAFLIVLGSLGFPVHLELLDRLRYGGRFRRPHFSAHAVMTLQISLALIFVGALLVWMVEGFQNFGHSIFLSITSRTAGFSTMAMDSFSFDSQVLTATLMIIGGGALSTAGGLKVSTLGVLILAAWSYLRGQAWIQFHRSEISLTLLQKALAVVLLYFIALGLGFFLLLALEQQPAWALFFEAVSALSTVGLSLGITSELSPMGKSVIMALMFMGRFGLVTLIYLGIGSARQQRFHYGKASVYIG
jgi:Trk-type K+ transport system membrane component